MDLLLNEQQSMLVETATRLCADFGGPKRLRALNAAGAEFDKVAWNELILAGWLATAVAEDHDGSGLGAFEVALIAEQAGKALLQVPLVEATAAARTLSMAAEVPKSVLAEMLDGAGVLVPATTAPFWSFGNPPAAAAFDAAAGALSAVIPFVPVGRSADVFLVALESRPDPLICVVPKAAAGVSITTSRNVDGSESSSLVLDNVEVPRRDVVATGAAAQRLTRQLQEMLMLGAGIELLGVAAAALDLTLDYIKLRQQFGRPIGSFQVLQHRAVNAFVDIELNRSLAYRVLAAFDAGEHDPAMVSAVKARTSRAALEIIRGALQMHGAIGYTEEHDIGLYYKRAIALAARYGNELQHTGRFSNLTLDAPHAPPRACWWRVVSATLRCDIDGRGIATLLLNRPDKGNCYNQTMLDALLAELMRLAADPAVRALVLRGAGKHFCVGAEIGGEAPAPGQPRTTIPVVCDALDRFPKPTIALVHGACIGGGLALVCGCDVVIAADDAFFSMPEVRLGFAPGPLIPFFLRAIDARSLRRYLLSGERFKADTALRIGLVHELCGADSKEEALSRLLAEILLAGPNAVTHAKLLLRRLERTSISAELIAELQADFDQRFGSDEANEGRASFREKRKPNWFKAP